jgi:hypothetical protein
MGITYKAASNIEVSVGANYSKSNGQMRWVTNSGYNDSLLSIFGKMDQTEFTPRVTFTYVPSPALSIQFSARTLISALSHRDFSVYNGGQDYDENHPVINYAALEEANEYNYSAINSTLLMRWEYRPGSTLYVVWTRSRDEYDPTTGAFDMSRDVKRFFKGNDNNLFLIKASYWWNI